MHVGRRELERAFRRHAQVGNKEVVNDSGLLLLIYAIECGLKRLLLETRGLHSTERLEEDDLTHDLDQLLKIVGGSPRFCFASIKLDGANEHINSEKLHQALRYGVRLHAQDRERIFKVVTNIVVWLEEAMA